MPWHYWGLWIFVVSIWICLLLLIRAAARDIDGLMERMDDVEEGIEDLRKDLDDLEEEHEDLKDDLIDKNIITDPYDDDNDN